MSLLTIVTEHCRIHALNVPTTVVGSQDTTIRQILGLLNSLLEDVIDESKWQAFTYEALFTLQPQEDQGDIGLSIVPNQGYLWMTNGTMFDRTLRRPVYGPASDIEWQQLKALPNPGPWYKYRIRNNHLLINPVPKAGQLSQIAFEYASSFGVLQNDGVLKAQFNQDTDSSVLPERILKKGLAYRWKELKGLPYGEEQKRYFNMLNNYIARDKTPRSFNLAGGPDNMLKPGIFVPSGNWPLR